MKNKLNLIIFIALGILLIASCKKDPNLRMPDLQKSVVPLLNKDASNDQIIDFFNMNTFTGGVVVDLYYKDLPKNMDIMVSFNGKPDSIGILKTGITTFPTIVTFDINTFSAAVNKPVNKLKLGDFFRVYAVTTLDDGTILNGNDTLYDAFNNSVVNLPGTKLYTDFTIVCPLVLNDFLGDFLMDDGSPSDLCTITVSIDPAHPNDGLIINHFYEGTGVGTVSPVYMQVNLNTYGITLQQDPQVFVSKLWNNDANGKLSNLSGSLNACDGTFKFKAGLTSDIYSYGTINYTCTRP